MRFWGTGWAPPPREPAAPEPPLPGGAQPLCGKSRSHLGATKSHVSSGSGRPWRHGEATRSLLSPWHAAGRTMDAVREERKASRSPPPPRPPGTTAGHLSPFWMPRQVLRTRAPVPSRRQLSPRNEVPQAGRPCQGKFIFSQRWRLRGHHQGRGGRPVSPCPRLAAGHLLPARSRRHPSVPIRVLLP